MDTFHDHQEQRPVFWPAPPQDGTPLPQEPAPAAPVPEAEAVPPEAAAEAPLRNPQPQEPLSGYVHPQSASAPYRYVPQQSGAAPAGQPPVKRKASPYENAPYVLQHPREETGFRYEPQIQPKAPREKKQRSGFWRRTLSAVLVLALVVCGCAVTAFTVNQQWELRSQETATALNQRISALEQQLQELPESTPAAGESIPGAPTASGDGAMTPAQLYARNVNSVVAISVSVQSYAYGQYVDGSSSGSGFILTEDGYVVTNYHVIEGATSVSVVMYDETVLAATVVGYDATNDVAVLKVEATGLPAVTLGSSEDLTVGDMVVAIGNPLGELNATQTVGYICGKDREVTTGGTIINMLQTDAAINPGNSGGPLFNMKGEVVGITTAKYSGTTSSGASIEGIGFAIPIDDIEEILLDLKEYGYVTGPYLGITVQNVDASFTEAYGISGATIIGIEPGYAAERAGLKVKDIIVALNGEAVGSITELTRALRNYNAGDTVTVTVIRGGVNMDISVTLDEKPQTQASVPSSDIPMPSEGDFEEWYDYFDRYFGG